MDPTTKIFESKIWIYFIYFSLRIVTQWGGPYGSKYNKIFMPYFAIKQNSLHFSSCFQYFAKKERRDPSMIINPSCKQISRTTHAIKIRDEEI